MPKRFLLVENNEAYQKALGDAPISTGLTFHEVVQCNGCACLILEDQYINHVCVREEED